MPSPNSTAGGPGPIPIWAWLFVAICAAIPLVTMGGAIPAGIGCGGAGACIGVARNEQMPVAARFGICLAISVVCWGLFLAVLSAITGRPFLSF